MEFDKTVLVAGCGKSGLAAAAVLLDREVSVLLYDAKETLCEAEVRRQVAALQKAPDKGTLKLCFGNFPEGDTDAFSCVILSPGVPSDLPFVESLRKAGIPIWGEIELAYRLGKGRIIGITGTNGKTTTTTLVGDMMKAYFPDTVVVGNIGNPYVLEVASLTETSVVVAEISSFQLETIEAFHPEVTAVLNVTPDHLNRHHTMENYIKLKQDITKNQTKEEVCVLNYDDPVTRDMAKTITARPFFFSRLACLEEGICLEGDQIVLKRKGTAESLLSVKELLIPGSHNVENAMAALAVGLAMGVPKESLVHTLKHFHAVEHRIEFVAEKKGVVYYNDSKATNTDAAIKGIQAMDRKTVLIGGGFDKGSSYDSWFQAFDGRVKAMVLIGQTREKIAETAKRFQISDVSYAESLEEAVKLSSSKAEPGEAVLLSPACASWGMFDNYEQRGRLFKEYVNQLEDA